MVLNDSYIMVVETSDYLHRLEANQFNLFTQKLHNSITKTVVRYNGNVVQLNDNKYVIAFEWANEAVLFGLKLESKFKYITPNFDSSIRRLKIGICHPLDSQDTTVQMATDMCEFVKERIVISSVVKDRYEESQNNSFLNSSSVRILNPSEFQFLDDLMTFLNLRWNDYELSVDDLTDPLGYSQSQIYRKLVSLTGRSPSHFIRDYRLNKALDLIHNRKGTIGNIANQSGFRNPGYFSKCFKERFGLLASKYVKQHAS